jgi:uncharacterized protein YuzE
MKIKYDSSADSMYIRFREGDVDHTVEVDDDTILDYNETDQIVGVELLFVKERNPGFMKDLLADQPSKLRSRRLTSTA